MITAILTGQRPLLLKQTLEALYEYCPKMLARNKIIIFNNSGDQPTRDVINQYSFDMVYEAPYVRTCGEAYSFIGKQIQTFYPKEEYLLFIEDDWVCTLGEDEWVNQSIKLISKKNVSQVRLRHTDEKVLSKHMVTGKPIRWIETDGGYMLAEAAHLTFNPSFLKINDLRRFLPASGEREAQKNFVSNGMKGVVQLLPGVFRHIGDEDSLRSRTRCPA